MILVRDVFQAKYGQGDKLVALFKESLETWGGPRKVRILTDVSGPFFTVVTEEEVESLSALEENLSEAFADPEFETWFAKMVPLVETGSREFYNIE